MSIWRANSIAVVVGGLLLGGVFGVAATATAAPADRPAPLANRVLFSLDVGKQISYEGQGPEQMVWGPAGLAVSDAGTIWIIDGAARRLLGFGPAGTPAGTVNLTERVVGIGGLATYGSMLVVLDSSAQTPKVLVLDSGSGKTISAIELPDSASLEEGLSGVGVEPDGTIYAQLEGGNRIVRIGALSPLRRALTPITSEASSELRLAVGTVHVREQSDWSLPVEVEINGRLISIASADKEITAQFAGATADKLFLEVTELSQDLSGKLLVDSTIRIFSPSADAIGVVRVPKGEAILSSMTTITPNGRILALVTDMTTVSVVELGVVTPGALADVLPAMPAPGLVGTGYEDSTASQGREFMQATTAAAACVNRSTMGSRESEYRTNSQKLSSTNISGTCSGRTKPHYLGSAGTYSSVPYKWGGFDSVSSFNANMSPGTGKAGDVTSGDTLSCAYGVDCSGFVSRVWGLSAKKSTSTLPGITAAIPESWLQPYDIFNKSGHVMFFRSKTSGGYYVSEATTKDNVDRVVYQFQKTSYVADFSPRRYGSVCCNPSVEPCP